MNPAPARRKSPRILATSVAALLGFLACDSRATADQFWDGPNVNNTKTEGGTGTWNTVTTNTNWTDAAGTVNTFYDPTQTAVFGVTAGTVTLGSSLAFTNLSFDVDGYTIAGGGFTLAPTGTAILDAGTGFGATISAQLTGTGGISLQGAGKITLTSALNDYAGGTTLANGSLFVSTGSLGSGPLTISAAGGPVLLGSNANGTTITNKISVLSDFSVATAGFGEDFTLSGVVDLNGATRTITGVTPGGQVHFGAGGIGVAGETGGLTLNTYATAFGDYVAFIFDPTNVNKYTGLTTLNNGAFIVLTGSTANGAIQGNVLIQGDGVVDYLGSSGSPFSSEQIADNATVVVNSAGNTLGSGSSAVAFTGLDFFNATGTETIGSLFGNANGTVGLSKATLAVGAGDFAGIISDGNHGFTGGKLIKYGTGTLILEGANTYTGTTTVNGGVLILTGSLTSAVTVNNGSEFDVGLFGGVTQTTAPAAVTLNNNGDTFSSAGAIVGGAAGVVATGSGNTITNGVGGTITGTKAINLTGVTATGNNVIVNLGTLTGSGGTAIDASGSAASVALTNAGVINGNVVLTSLNDLLTVATGSVITGTINSGGGIDALHLVGGGIDTTDLNKYPGFNSLTKLGGGTWTVTGTGTFAGGTTIGGGEFLVEGNLISDVLVQTAGTLGGHGLITGNVINSGTVSLGGATGTLTVKGNYAQQSGGTLVIRVGGAKVGQYDALVVQGQAALAGNLQIVKLGGVPRLKVGDKITFLTATGGVTGNFSKVVNPFANDTMVSGEVIYGSDSVVLEAVQTPYSELAKVFHLTPNQLSVGRMLDSVANDPRAKNLTQFLNRESLANIPGDLTRIAPEELASIFRLGIALANVQGGNLQRRTADIRSGLGGFSAAGFQAAGNGPSYSGGLAGPAGSEGKGDESAAPAVPDKRWGTFITGAGEYVHVGDTDNARGYDLTTGGYTVGVDYKATPNLAVGLSAGYAATSANLSNDGRVAVNGLDLGIYATYFTGGFYADAVVSGGQKSYDTERSALKGDARGSADGKELDLLFGTGYFWKEHRFTFGPTATLEYTDVSVDGFSERGSLAPLEFGSQANQSLRSTLGFKVSYDWKLGDAIVRPELRAAWQHEYDARSFALDSRLASGAGGIFTVNDTEVGRDSLLLGGGVAVLWNARASTYLYYDGELARKEYDSHNVSGGVRFSF